MLRKLAVGGIKNRWKDYLVLFSGLVISSSIFYLFETLSTNGKYLKENGAIISMIGYIFTFGSVLLMLITLVYINYANNFLLSMRQRDYGLFMMLGARKRKIGQLIWIETMLIGFLSTFVGIIVGIILSTGMQNIVIKALGLTTRYYEPIWWKAILWTLILYLGLFFLAAIYNTFLMTKKPALKLLKSQQKAAKKQLPIWIQIIQALIGVILLTIGYGVILNAVKYGSKTIPISLFTITFGTFFVFNSIVTVGIGFLRKATLAKKKLNGFTLGQLEFRVHDYTKMLTVVTMLLALALGAITTGIGFNNITDKTAQSQSAYTFGLFQPTSKQKALIKKLDVERQSSYSYKVSGNAVYFEEAQFKAQPFETVKFNNKNFTSSYTKLSAADLKKKSYILQQFTASIQPNKQVVLVDGQKFAAIQGQTQTALFFRAEDTQSAQSVLSQISNLEYAKSKQTDRTNAIQGNYDAKIYIIKPLYSGLEFMGIFLGIAFLAMLASCLMFKILSGAFADIKRYAMLSKLGVRKSLLQGAIAKEIGVLFVLPAIVGVVHVLVGLNLFKGLLINPYYGIWLPFSIFAVLYLIYYLIIFFMYQRIVLKNKI
ncbi:FtsX-like permease family protein [Lactobacillus sp. UCMA15818]|uniref:ABC transporter permease n=1 Tax=Lactobacillus sp. UCMA15818 TaxID=2583394 RepID=UPI0025B03BDC|nr:FtsX-like permease family protein [Lactobacillus sp. UCMA15818]MDN2454298.1 FtsX-like permease family protein [Lactobacillus sp. UCMA15818]